MYKDAKYQQHATGMQAKMKNEFMDEKTFERNKKRFIFPEL